MATNINIKSPGNQILVIEEGDWLSTLERRRRRSLKETLLQPLTRTHDPESAHHDVCPNCRQALPAAVDSEVLQIEGESH